MTPPITVYNSDDSPNHPADLGLLHAFTKVAEVLPRYLYDLRPPELATLCRSFAEAGEDAAGDDISGGM